MPSPPIPSLFYSRGQKGGTKEHKGKKLEREGRKEGRRKILSLLSLPNFFLSLAIIELCGAPDDDDDEAIAVVAALLSSLTLYRLLFQVVVVVVFSFEIGVEWRSVGSACAAQYERDVEAGGRGGPEARECTRERGLHYSRLRHLAFVRLARSYEAVFVTLLDFFHCTSSSSSSFALTAAAEAAAGPKPPLELCRLHWLGTSER